MFGWVAGVGGETKIYNSNWLFRVENLHYDFGDQLSSVSTQVTPGVVNQNFGRTSGTLTADVVRAGLSYKFGGPIY
jgi:opacity protein-like surface antigen